MFPRTHQFTRLGVDCIKLRQPVGSVEKVCIDHVRRAEPHTGERLASRLQASNLVRGNARMNCHHALLCKENCVSVPAHCCARLFTCSRSRSSNNFRLYLKSSFSALCLVCRSRKLVPLLCNCSVKRACAKMQAEGRRI